MRALEIVNQLNRSGEWSYELCEELCDLAGLSEDWENADGENFEQVVYEAAKILNVNLD